MKSPEINLEELKKWKEKNFRERLEFLEKYAEWVKRKSQANRVSSSS